MATAIFDQAIDSLWTVQTASEPLAKQADNPAMYSPQDHRRRARTKIVATVGPASGKPEQLSQLLQSGVDTFRLNMAHAGPDEQQAHVDAIRRLSQESGEPIAILVDLAGP